MSIMLGYFDAISVSTKLDIFNKYVKQKELYFWPSGSCTYTQPDLNHSSVTTQNKKTET